ncbi:MAG: methyltransferase domain-containing protein [bacterium]|nr:methyltransferase domain-containing protein [bacterium]
MIEHEDVGSFYEAEITRFWEMVHQKHMHVGYWDESNPNASLYEASLRFSEMMVEWADVGQGERFIDIGCGYGIPGIMLAKSRGCEVDGITASDYQKDEAVKMAAEEGLSGKARFLVGDANALPFEDNSFDGGWFFESIFHMGHESALKEAHRVLKPGASLIIADFPRLGPMTDEDDKFFKEVFFVNTLVTIDEYPALMDRSGFDLLELRDITKETMPGTWYDGAYLRETRNRKDELIELGGDGFYNMLEALWPQTEVMTKRNLGFCVVFAKKR